MKLPRGKLTYANVISTLCLFLLVGGGTAFAAAKIRSDDIAASAVETSNLHQRAVTSGKLAIGAVTENQIADSAVGLGQISGSAKRTLGGQSQAAKGEAGARGERGEPGERGPEGEPGERGPSHGFVVNPGPSFNAWDGSEQLLTSLPLPAGSFIINSYALGNNNAAGSAGASCLIKLGDTIIGESGVASLGGNTNEADRQVISISVAGTLASPGTAELFCQAQAGFPGNWLERGMTAVQVASLTG